MSKTANPNYRWVILAINFFICALAYAGLTTWSIASPVLAETFKITALQASLGSSVFMGGYAVGSFVQATIAPKIGYRYAGLIGLSLMCISMFCIPIATSYTLVLILRFCQGWGILWLVGVNSSVAWFPLKQRGLASGVIGGGLTLGIGIGGLIATGLINAAGSWQAGFRVFGFIILGASIIWALLMKEPVKGMYEEVEAQAAPIQKSGRKINPYATMAAWLCAFCLFFNCWQLIGFNSVVSGYMSSVGYTDVQAGLAILLCGLIGVASTPIGGIISDRLVKKGMAPIKARAYTMAIPGFLVAAITTVIFPFVASSSIGMCLLWSVLVGWGVPVTNATLGALPMDVLGDEEAAGKMFGMIIFVGIFAGGILAPYIATAASEAFGWTGSFIVLGLGALVGAIIGIVLPKFKLKN